MRATIFVTVAFAVTCSDLWAQSVDARYIVRFRLQDSGRVSAGTLQVLNRIVAGLGEHALQDIDRIPHDNAAVVRMRIEHARALSARPDVESLELDSDVHALFDTNDPLFSQQYALSGEYGIHANQAWDTTTGSRRALVAIIDTGSDLKHPDLQTNLWRNTKEIAGNRRDDDANGCVDDMNGCDLANRDGVPQDDHGHGTHVAGIIAAYANNGSGVAGVSWSSRIVTVKALGSDGSGYVSNVIKAIDYVTDLKKSGAPIVAINLSLGGNSYSDALYRSVERARNHEIIIVAAAGNNSSNNDLQPLYPANFSINNVLSVAATNVDGALASYSNYGASVHIAAPGSGIVSTALQSLGTQYRMMSGTSMASPHVAGVIALVAAANPALSMSQIRTLILSSARQLPALQGAIYSNAIVDASAAVSTARSTAPLSRLFGYVRDGTRPVREALVKLQSRTTPGLVLTTTTGKDGSYSISELPLGSYTVLIRKAGKRFPVTSLRVKAPRAIRSSFAAR